MADVLMTLQELADYLGLEYETIRQYAHRGSIPTVKMGKNLMVEKSWADDMKGRGVWKIQYPWTSK